MELCDALHDPVPSSPQSSHLAVSAEISESATAVKEDAPDTLLSLTRPSLSLDHVPKLDEPLTDLPIENSPLRLEIKLNQADTEADTEATTATAIAGAGTTIVPLKILEGKLHSGVPKAGAPATDAATDGGLDTGAVASATGTRDYMEPINLESPQKGQNRSDSAYFSATESPGRISTSQSSPRKSVAFASLPARQPFAKKSMGPRSSQSRASMLESNKSLAKTPSVHGADLVVFKVEEPSSPGLTLENRAETNTGHGIVTSLSEQRSRSESSITEIVPVTLKPAQVASGSQSMHDTLAEPLSVFSEGPRNTFMSRDTQNPFDNERELVRSPKVDIVDEVLVEDDDWLPRFETAVLSPKTNGGVEVLVETTRGTKQHETATEDHLQNPLIITDRCDDDKMTPGPIRAAMQAASAKATSYLRQARTAFGSPSMAHTKVFKSTTPMQSPPKPRFKMEPQTPKLYPEMKGAQVGTKPSMIPSMSPKKSPLKPRTMTEDSSPRRSPRRSPKKGSQAMQSMAVIAARNATVKAAGETHAEVITNKKNVEKDVSDSPHKASKLVSKFSIQTKAKPLSIRVATASQREIDHAKDRRTLVASTLSQGNGSMNILSKSTNESGQTEYVSKSEGNNKRPGPSRQIKALAAANQAKERAEKEQERREQQRKDIERKRTENAKRQADEEERRKLDNADEQNRKRKAHAEARSLSTKKQIIRAIPSHGPSRESHVKDIDAAYTKSTSHSSKRALSELEENILPIMPLETKRQRISEQTELQPSHGTSTVISKPVRVSLQKKSMFGHPGEPGYKKPGTAVFAKVGPVTDAVKFSNEPVRFANTNNTSTQDQSKTVNLPPSELIELPEINSDYSDSDSDDAPNPKDGGFERPNWAVTPELRKLLRRQQKIDPDDVFGPIQPLQMEEIFKGKERALARFRPRSSSANWSGNDKLSAEEVVDYARAMGYKN